MNFSFDFVIAWAALIGMVGWIAYSFWRGLRRGLRGESAPEQLAQRERATVAADPRHPPEVARANRIMLAYAAVLKDGGTGPRPVTDLPAPVADIKEAILRVGQYWHARGLMPPNRVSELRAAYGVLADFGNPCVTVAVAEAGRTLSGPNATTVERRANALRFLRTAVGDPNDYSVRAIQELYAEWDARWAEIVRTSG